MLCSVTHLIVSKLCLVHFANIHSMQVTSPFKLPVIERTQKFAIFKWIVIQRIFMDLSPSFCLLSLIVKRKQTILHQFLPCFFEYIFVFSFILCLLNEVVEILIVMVEAEQTHLLEVPLLNEMVQLREK